MENFRERLSFEERKAESDRVRAEYPDRIPVFVEKSKGSSLPNIDKQKFLVPSDLLVGQLLFVIRKGVKLSSEKTILIYVNEKKNKNCRCHDGCVSRAQRPRWISVHHIQW
ncbi:hypothetical protein BSKO_10942 [Bryopsis sp. KO-2023]|nr:hypothetical protein BSKO_10942 [Bryopsis sp. KO-2023]